jgi:hypothetical protein
LWLQVVVAAVLELLAVAALVVFGLLSVLLLVAAHQQNPHFQFRVHLP